MARKPAPKLTPKQKERLRDPKFSVAVRVVKPRHR